MPTVNGKMYAEGRSMLHQFNVLNVLILGDITSELKDFTNDLEVVRNYIQDKIKNNISIQLHCTDVVPDSVAQIYEITKHDIHPLTNDELLKSVADFDIDVVYDQADIFDLKFLWSKFYDFETVKSFNDFRASLENFLIGSGVAWSFTIPAWNTPLFMKYITTPGLCMDYYNFMNECGSKGYTSDQKERVRYIMNKIKQVDYSRDLLQYYIKRMRKARRRGMPEDDYNLQLNYHLSNYYFLMAGTLDSLARLINDVHKLNLKAFADLSIEKDNFIAANRRKRTGFARMFKVSKAQKWIRFLKERRNFIAHEGDMRQVPIVKQKVTPLTDEQINEIIDSQLDWSLLASYLPADLYQAHREQAVEMTRIQNDYEQVAEKIMMIPSRKGGYKMHSPLTDVDHDYTSFATIMNKALLKLKG